MACSKSNSILLPPDAISMANRLDSELRSLGWLVGTIWERATCDPSSLNIILDGLISLWDSSPHE